MTGLSIRGCRRAGVTLKGTHALVEANRIAGNAIGVEVGRTSSDNLIRRNRLVANDRLTRLTRTPGDDTGAFGVLLNGDRNVVVGNRISGSDAFSYDYGRDGSAVEIFEGRDNLVARNLAIDNDAFAELGGEGAHGNVFRFNVVRSSLTDSRFLITRGAGDRHGPVTGTRLLGNTVLLTGATSEGLVCFGGCGPQILVARGNIIQAVAKAAYADGRFTEGDNLFWGGRIQMPRDDSRLVGDPRFVDAAAGDLRLRSGSPAIDRGATGICGADFNGATRIADGDGDGVVRRDIGAMEYGLPAPGRTSGVRVSPTRRCVGPAG